MLSEKPWRLEAVMLFGAGLLVSLTLGSFSGMLLEHYLPEKSSDSRRFYNFVLSTVSFQGVALVLTHLFLKQHQMTWKEFLGLTAPRLGQAMAWALGATLLALPLTFLLIDLSAWIITLFQIMPVEQSPIKMLRVSVGLGQRVCFGIAAILIAPVVEEILFRGVLYPAIKQRGYPRLAFWGTSLLFAAIHINLMTFLPLTFLAIILVALYEKTDNLLAPILTHCFFNAVNFLMLIYETDLADWLSRLAP